MPIQIKAGSPALPLIPQTIDVLLPSSDTANPNAGSDSYASGESGLSPAPGLLFAFRAGKAELIRILKKEEGTLVLETEIAALGFDGNLESQKIASIQESLSRIDHLNFDQMATLDKNLRGLTDAFYYALVSHSHIEADQALIEAFKSYGARFAQLITAHIKERQEGIRKPLKPLGFVAQAQEPSAVPLYRLAYPSRGGTIVSATDGMIQAGLGMWGNKDNAGRWAAAGGFGPNITSKDAPHLIPTVVIIDLDYNPYDDLLVTDFQQYMFFLTKGTPHTIVLDNAHQAAYAEAMMDEAYVGDQTEFLDDELTQEYVAGTKGMARLAHESVTGFISPPTGALRKTLYFDGNGEVRVSPNMVIRKLGPQIYEYIENGKSLGVVNLKDKPLPRPTLRQKIEALRDPEFQAVRRKFVIEGRTGLWPIGTAHGFDPKGETSGHMIWKNGRVTLVDPPSSTLEYFISNGIPLDLIEGVIITHGHTDHFGNSIPRLLEALPAIKIYSTSTIYRHLMEQYILSKQGLGEVDYQKIFALYKSVKGENDKFVLEMENRYSDLITSGPVDKPKGIRLFVGLYWRAMRDSELVDLKQQLNSYFVNMGAPGLFDWKFVEMAPKELTEVNKLGMKPNYGYHPIPAKGHEIWGTTKDGHKQLMVYFSGDTMAVPFDQEVNGKKCPGVWSMVAAGEMDVFRGLDILRHYFMLPFMSLIPMKNMTPEQKAKAVTEFILSKESMMDLADRPNLHEAVRQYIAELSIELQCQENPALFLIEGGMPPIHTPPKLTNDFAESMKKWFFKSFGLTRDNTLHFSKVEANLLLYHTSDEQATGAGRIKWLEGHKGAIDLDHLDANNPSLDIFDLRSRAVSREPTMRYLMPQRREAFSRGGEIVQINPGENLIEKDGDETYFYIIMDGEFEILDDQNQVISIRRSGLLGEGPILNQKRSHTVRASVPSQVIRYAVNTFGDYMRMDSVKEHKRKQRENREIAKNALKVSPFSELPPEIVDGVLMIGEAKPALPAGHVLIKQGDTTNLSAYLITGGSAKVVKKDGTVVAILNAGDLVGEMASVLNAPRSATVIAGDDGLKTIELPANELDSLQKEYPGIAGVLRRLTRERVKGNASKNERPQSGNSPSSEGGADAVGTTVSVSGTGSSESKDPGTTAFNGALTVAGMRLDNIFGQSPWGRNGPGDLQGSSSNGALKSWSVKGAHLTLSQERALVRRLQNVGYGARVQMIRKMDARLRAYLASQHPELMGAVSKKGLIGSAPSFQSLSGSRSILARVTR